jgi:hypothetical protein
MISQIASKSMPMFFVYLLNNYSFLSTIDFRTELNFHFVLSITSDYFMRRNCALRYRGPAELSSFQSQTP